MDDMWVIYGDLSARTLHSVQHVAHAACKLQVQVASCKCKRARLRMANEGDAGEQQRSSNADGVDDAGEEGTEAGVHEEEQQHAGGGRQGWQVGKTKVNKHERRDNTRTKKARNGRNKRK